MTGELTVPVTEPVDCVAWQPARDPGGVHASPSTGKRCDETASVEPACPGGRVTRPPARATVVVVHAAADTGTLEHRGPGTEVGP